MKDENKLDCKIKITERLLEILPKTKNSKKKFIFCWMIENKFKWLEETKEMEQGNESQAILTEKYKCF